MRYSSISADELIRACVEFGDDDAWEEFVSRFHRPISLSVLRTARHWGDVPRQIFDDLVQDTYVKLCADKCRLLHGFARQHPEAVPGYIKTVAANVVRDHFKSFHSQKRGAGRSPESMEEVHPKAAGQSLGSQGSIERQILLEQIDQCLGKGSAGPDLERDRLIFWLYYRHGMSAKAIAALPTVGLSAKGVESSIFRLTRLVRQQIVDVRSDGQNRPGSGEKGFRPAESY
jgi:RNA polymerase sigma-70 factor (ECF subfamily)